MRSRAGVRFLTAAAVVVVGVAVAAFAVARLGAGVQTSRAQVPVPTPELPPLPPPPNLPAPPPPPPPPAPDPTPPPTPELPPLPSVPSAPSSPSPPPDAGAPADHATPAPTETRADTDTPQVGSSARSGSTRTPGTRVRRPATLHAKGGLSPMNGSRAHHRAAPTAARTPRASRLQGMRRTLDPVAAPTGALPSSAATAPATTEAHHKGLVARLVASHPVAEAGRGTAAWDSPLVMGLMALVAISLGGVVKQFRDVLRYG